MPLNSPEVFRNSHFLFLFINQKVGQSMRREEREKAEKRKKKLTIGLNLAVVIHSLAFFLGMIHFA